LEAGPERPTSLRNRHRQPMFLAFTRLDLLVVAYGRLFKSV
jgi:hypothetical protein